MQRMHLVMIVAGLAICAACERKSEFITETSPFTEVTVTTPADGKAAIARRAERFAHQHGMKSHFAFDHFEPHEFSLAVNRADLNILADNVQRGSRSTVRAYAQSAPTGAQRAEVAAYLCEVMRHNCPR